jgi:TPR repeat protein
MKLKLVTTKAKCMDEVYCEACYLSDLGYESLSCKLLYALAAENHPESLTALAICFSEGSGVRKNKHKALFYYKEAARLKEPVAMFNLGLFYRDDMRVYGKALYWLRRLEKDEKAYHIGEAKIELAKMYLKGLGVKKDVCKAKQMLEKLRDTSSLFKTLSEGDQEEVINLLNEINKIRDKSASNCSGASSKRIRG